MVRSTAFHWLVLVTALLLYALGFFWLADGWLPGVLGLLLLPFILYAADALGITARLRDLPPPQAPHRRQYVLLRSKVTLLLDLVKRVNWLAVDVDRGYRAASEVEAEIDRAVGRMKDLVDEIRDAAGQASDDPEDPGPPYAPDARASADVAMEG